MGGLNLGSAIDVTKLAEHILPKMQKGNFYTTGGITSTEAEGAASATPQTEIWLLIGRFDIILDDLEATVGRVELRTNILLGQEAHADVTAEAIKPDVSRFSALSRLTGQVSRLADINNSLDNTARRLEKAI